MENSFVSMPTAYALGEKNGPTSMGDARLRRGGTYTNLHIWMKTFVLRYLRVTGLINWLSFRGTAATIFRRPGNTSKTLIREHASHLSFPICILGAGTRAVCAKD